MWVAYALLAAVGAACVAILGKIGVTRVDPVLATAVRSVVMAAVVVVAALAGGKARGFGNMDVRAWLAILGAGVAGAVSWLAYFLALRTGPATHVAAIDRLSIVLVVILAVVFLGEALTWKVGIGAILMVAGAILITS